MKRLRVGLLIPAHNVAPYIGAALDSVLAQTRAVDQIVVVDDGSSDDTAEVVRAWERSNSQPITLLAQPCGGAASARNLGLAHLDADLVALLDADDVMLPDHICRAESAFDRHRDLVLYFSDVEVFSEERVVQRRFLEDSPLETLRTTEDGDGVLFLEGSVYRSLLGGNYMPVSTTVMAHWAVKQVGFYDPQFINAADRDLNLRLSRVGRFACYPAVSARKRWREDSLSQPLSGLAAMQYRVQVLRKMEMLAPALDLDDRDRRETRSALQAQALDLLYGASRNGLTTLFSAWRFLVDQDVWTEVLNLRHLARAVFHSIQRRVPQFRRTSPDFDAASRLVD